MGLRGPAPKPTVLEIAEGRPGKRAINRREPQPAKRVPKMPIEVRADKAAKREWRRLVPMLDRLGVLTEVDGTALGMVCLDTSLLERSQADLREKGTTVKGPKGGLLVNPLLKIIESTSHRIWIGLREFGLTPASRSRIVADPPARDADLETVLNSASLDQESPRPN